MVSQYAPIDFRVIAPAVKQRLARLPSAIDSFLEDHILRSAHFKIYSGMMSRGSPRCMTTS